MEVLDEAQASDVFRNLTRQFTALGSSNLTINSKRSAYFFRLCESLNGLYKVPDGYCPFYWDGIICWNATAPFQSIHSPCASWPMSKYPPENQLVERKCLSGYWENMTTRSLEMLYENCNPHMDKEQVQSIALIARFVAFIGYFCSALALLFAFLIFIYLKKLKCGPNRIHLNLFIAFFLRFVLSAVEFIYAVKWREIPEKECFKELDFDWSSVSNLIIVLWNYSILASYGWVFIEGLYLHNSIFFNVFKESKPIFYILGGWIAPFMIIIVWSVLKATIDNTKHWVVNCNDDIHWVLRGPLMIITIAEVFITISIIIQLYSKVKNEVYLDERAKYRRFAKSFLYLLLSIGGTHFIFDIVLHSTSILEGNGILTLFLHCVYVVINSLWGIVISYIYCFNNIEIKTALSQRDKSPCRIHSQSPLSLSTKDNEKCPQCVLNEKLLELNRLSDTDIGTDGFNTVCSTIVNSEQNTFHKAPQRVYPRVTYLSFCREEGDEITENSSSDL